MTQMTQAVDVLVKGIDALTEQTSLVTEFLGVVQLECKTVEDQVFFETLTGQVVREMVGSMVAHHAGAMTLLGVLKVTQDIKVKAPETSLREILLEAPDTVGKEILHECDALMAAGRRFKDQVGMLTVVKRGGVGFA